MSDEMIKLTIDGQEVEAAPGTSVLEAARTIGIKIPTFCYHPDLSWCGQCRMCFVEVEKMPKLATSCCTTVGPDMVVRTNTDLVREARRAVLEFQLLHHPIDCPICDQAGECHLQDYYVEYGLYDNKFDLEDKNHHKKHIDLGEHIVHDRERCIHCFRCVRFCAEVSGSHALKAQWRGGHTEIVTFNERPIEDTYSGNLVDICPVGALTSKKFRFKCRSWLLDKVDSICTGCSTGCNIRIDSYQNEIQRYVARRNPDVNKSWICDEGRMSWTALQNVNRLEAPMAREEGGSLQPVSWDEALEILVSKINGAGKDIAGITSAQASNEELFLFKTLLTDVCGGSRLEFRMDGDYELLEEMEDHLLRRKDRNPNTRGALDIGADMSGIDAITKDAAAGSIPLLLIYKQDLIAKKPAAKEIMDNTFTVVFTPYKTDTARAADLVLPVAEHFETEGSFTNFAGISQRFEKAVDGPGETREGWLLLKDLLLEMESSVVFGSSVSITDALNAELEAKAAAIAKDEEAEQAIKGAEEKAKADIAAAQESAQKTQAAAVNAAVAKTKAEAEMEMDLMKEKFEEDMDDAVDEAVKKALAGKEAGSTDSGGETPATEG